MTTPPTPPETLFHITAEENMVPIYMDGFKAVFGNYFSSTIENAGRFIAIRSMFDPEQKWVAFEIETNGLKVELSHDHSPEFFGTDDSWVIWGDIGPEHIVNVYEVTFGKEVTT